ncbi:unnamed protein product [Urochloa decumbens]|uniref:F-box domain-containing protein n=1 Tax=Urochloa decumbens TaxID=240449 RepID=A0ABC9C106_9POAL
MKMVVPASWEDLPADLIGLVLLRLPSLADRVRLRAACRPWRAAAKQMKPSLPLPLPWLAFRDGSIVDLDGAPVRCAPILRDGVFRYLAVDNFAFLIHDDGACSLMNPLSGLTLPLPKIAPVVCRAIDRYYFYQQSQLRTTHDKVILSSPFDSTLDPLLTSIILEGNDVVISACKNHDAVNISMCPESSQLPPTRHAKDISFLNGKLYALTEYEGLWSIKLDANLLSEPKSSLRFHQCIPKDPTQHEIHWCPDPNQQQPWDPSDLPPGYIVVRYLAESNGRLLMIRRWMAFPRKARLGTQERTSRFEVFEADLSTVPGQWVKVDNLDGQAIFLRAVPTHSFYG